MFLKSLSIFTVLTPAILGVQFIVSIQILPIVNILLFLTLIKFSILGILENLFKYESISNWQTIINCDGMNANIYLADKIMIQNIWYSFTKKIGKTRLYFPKQYKSPPFVTLTDNDTGAVVSNNLISVDWTTTTYVDVNNLQSGFTMLVIGVI